MQMPCETGNLCEIALFLEKYSGFTRERSTPMLSKNRAGAPKSAQGLGGEPAIPGSGGRRGDQGLRLF